MKKRQTATSPRATPNARKPRSPTRSKAESKPLSTSFTLAPECLVNGATAFKASLAKLLDRPGPVTLDISTLRRIDTSGIQLIAAFIRERDADRRTVEWQGTSPALATAAQLLGLTALLRLPA